MDTRSALHLSIVPSMQTRRSVRMCLDCRQMTETPILVHSVERASGPPWCVYACPDCAPARLPLDIAMSLLLDHTTHCADCTPLDSCAQGWALSRVVGRALRRSRPAPDSPPEPVEGS